MSKYTDADVARMLGWVEGDIGYHAPSEYHDSFNCPFGLSTPPGPEADANAARYVKPWLLGKSILFQALVLDILTRDIPDPRHVHRHLLLLDSPALCAAALEASDG